MTSNSRLVQFRSRSERTPDQNDEIEKQSNKQNTENQCDKSKTSLFRNLSSHSRLKQLKRNISIRCGHVHVSSSSYHEWYASRSFYQRFCASLDSLIGKCFSTRLRAEPEIKQHNQIERQSRYYTRHYYASNSIRSTKYTLLTFLPLNLWEQLTPHNKAANFYFLCIAILQSITVISTTQGRPAILVPLCFVLFVTALKDAFEDWNRAKLDRAKNLAIYTTLQRDSSHEEVSVSSPNNNQSQSQTSTQSQQRRSSPKKSASRMILSHSSFQRCYSSELHVGDIVRVNENQRIPADILLIASAINDSNTHCFVDTKDLDGETNLKPKFVPSKTLLNLCKKKNYNKLQELNLDLICDTVNGDMSEWKATISVQSNDHSNMYDKLDLKSDPNSITENLNLDHLILSDCVLRNTAYVIGMVVYTGEDTKLRQNMAMNSSLMLSSRHKKTHIFRLTQKLFVAMALLQFICCLVASIGAGVLQDQNMWYLDFDRSPAVTAILTFFTWFIICKDFVPISLYVSM